MERAVSGASAIGISITSYNRRSALQLIRLIRSINPSAPIAVGGPGCYPEGGLPEGVDLMAILRAFFKNLAAGHVVQGGSTITQQLARNLFLSQKKTLTRKIKEALTAIRLEHKYSKYEILELYLNQVYMGRGCYGVEAASRKFFDKPASELGPEEAALIVGGLRAPEYYLRNTKRAQKRRNVVLGLMEKSDFMDDVCHLSPEQYDSLKKIPALIELGKY